jgi:3-hydroxyacyl-CoA dehydrogenase
VDPYLIDTLMEEFGFAMGPLKVYDLSGIDIAVHVGHTFQDAYQERLYPSILFLKMAEAGRLGQKVGKGFYRYEGRKPIPDYAAIEPLIQAAKVFSQAQVIY